MERSAGLWLGRTLVSAGAVQAQLAAAPTSTIRISARSSRSYRTVAADNNDKTVIRLGAGANSAST